MMLLQDTDYIRMKRNWIMAVMVRLHSLDPANIKHILLMKALEWLHYLGRDSTTTIIVQAAAHLFLLATDFTNVPMAVIMIQMRAPASGMLDTRRIMRKVENGLKAQPFMEIILPHLLPHSPMMAEIIQPATGL